MKDNRIEIIISAINKATGPLKKATKDLSSFAKKNEKTFRKMRNVGAMVTASIGAVGIKAMDMAGNLELMNKKADIVLKEFRKDVEKTARVVSSRMGMTNLEFVTATTNIADLLVPMGFARKEAVKMSTDITKLSGALAEWSNGKYTAKETSEILAKAMLGETEQMKSLGVTIDQSSKAFNNRIKILMEDKGLTLEQAKAMDIQNQIFSKSTDAQEAYAKGAGGLIDKKKQLLIQFKNARDAVLISLIPAFNNLLESINPIIQHVSEWIQKNPGLVTSIGRIGLVLGGLATVLGTLGTILPPVITGVRLFTTALKTNPIIFFGTALIGLREGIIALANVFPTLQDRMESHIAQAKQLKKDYDDGKISLEDYTKKIAEHRKAIIELQEENKTFGGYLRNDFADVINKMAKLLTHPIDSLREMAREFGIIVNAIGGAFDKLAKIIVGSFIKARHGTKKFFNYFWNDITTTFDGIITSAKQRGSNMIQMFIDGLKAKVKELKNSVSNIASTISDYLGFHSPTKKGPGSDSHKWMPNLIKMLGEGLDAGKTKIEQLSKTLGSAINTGVQSYKAEEIQKGLEEMVSKVKDSLGDLQDKFKDSKDAIKGTTDKVKDLVQSFKDFKAEGKRAILDVNQELANLKKSAGQINLDFNVKRDRALSERYGEIQETLKKDDKAKGDSKMSYEERKKLKDELLTIQANINKEVLEEELAFQKLSKTEQMLTEIENERHKALEENKKKTEALLEKRALLEIQANKKGIGGENKIQLKEEDGLLKGFYEDKKGKLVEIKNFENVLLAEDIVNKQKNFQTQTQLLVDEFAKQRQAQVDTLSAMKTEYQTYSEFLDNTTKTTTENMISQLSKLQKSLETTIALQRKARLSRSSGSGARASGSRPIGGNVIAGQPYSVGEMGKELFVPSVNGKIIPNNQLNNQTPTVNITFTGGVHIKDEQDMNTFAEKVRQVMTQVYTNVALGTY